MNDIFYKNNIQKKFLIEKLSKKLTKNFFKIFDNISLDIKDNNKTLNILNDKYKLNFNIKDLKVFNRFKTIAIIGMGGSILGSEAIYSFLKTKIKKKFYFFDYLNTKKNLLFKEKENLNKVLFIAISKSGNTIETLSNLTDLKILKKNAKNIIIISEKNNNQLFRIANKFNLFFIEHKKNIGGRYSVLSEIGLVPAILMGINFKKLRKNTLKFFKGKHKLFLKESTIKLANLLKTKKIQNIIFLNYAPELEKFLFWCQQLLAESLGKEKKGFLPSISNVPKDYHSLLQLYLDGPKNKIFYFFSIDQKFQKKNTSESLEQIKNAQKKALIDVLKNKDIPFREFQINSINEYNLGEIFSYFILETILVGKLTGINPYSQPAVDLVKLITKKKLGKNSKKNF